MEYAMCTFITGNRNRASLVGVMMHELAHSWFQFVLATDETRSPWLDEGYTTFISTWVQKLLYEKQNDSNPWLKIIESYANYALRKDQEPVSLFSDSYKSNLSYWINAYDKGAAFLIHLVNVAGMEKTLDFFHLYYQKWKFKHPKPQDMLRCAEKATGMELDWLYNEWIESLHKVDYGIEKVESEGEKTRIVLKKYGAMPTAIDVMVILKNGDSRIYHVPYFRTLSYRAEPLFADKEKFRRLQPWYDGFPEYEFDIDIPLDSVKSIMVDPYLLALDIMRDNNKWKNK
jgi:aminopeptidase N